MEILLMFLLIALMLFAVLFLLLELYVVVIGDIKGAPFVPSEKRKVRIMLELARIKPGETVIDLGSGDGKIIIEAAKKGARAVGVEINPFLVWFSRWRVKRLGLENLVTILRQDFMKYNFGDADAVFIYLLPKAVEKIKAKMFDELKNGARVVSNTFPVQGWEPAEEMEKVRLYQIKK